MKLAGTFSIPENVKVYPLISPIAAPDTIVPPDTSNPCSKPAINTFPLLSSTKTVGLPKANNLTVLWSSLVSLVN